MLQDKLLLLSQNNEYMQLSDKEKQELYNFSEKNFYKNFYKRSRFWLFLVICGFMLISLIISFGSPPGSVLRFLPNAFLFILFGVTLLNWWEFRKFMLENLKTHN